MFVRNVHVNLLVSCVCSWGDVLDVCTQDERKMTLKQKNLNQKTLCVGKITDAKMKIGTEQKSFIMIKKERSDNTQQGNWRMAVRIPWNILWRFERGQHNHQWGTCNNRKKQQSHKLPENREKNRNETVYINGKRLNLVLLKHVHNGIYVAAEGSRLNLRDVKNRGTFWA